MHPRVLVEGSEVCCPGRCEAVRGGGQSLAAMASKFARICASPPWTRRRDLRRGSHRGLDGALGGGRARLRAQQRIGLAVDAKAARSSSKTAHQRPPEVFVMATPPPSYQKAQSMVTGSEPGGEQQGRSSPPDARSLRARRASAFVLGQGLDGHHVAAAAVAQIGSSSEAFFGVVAWLTVHIFYLIDFRIGSSCARLGLAYFAYRRGSR